MSVRLDTVNRRKPWLVDPIRIRSRSENGKWGTQAWCRCICCGEAVHSCPATRRSGLLELMPGRRSPRRNLGVNLQEQEAMHRLPRGLAFTLHLSETIQRHRRRGASHCKRSSNSTRSSSASFKASDLHAWHQLQDKSPISRSNFVKQAFHPSLSMSRSPAWMLSACWIASRNGRMWHTRRTR